MLVEFRLVHSCARDDGDWEWLFQPRIALCLCASQYRDIWVNQAFIIFYGIKPHVGVSERIRAAIQILLLSALALLIAASRHSGICHAEHCHFPAMLHFPFGGIQTILSYHFCPRLEVPIKYRNLFSTALCISVFPSVRGA